MKSAEKEKRLRDIQGTKLFEEFEAYAEEVIQRRVAAAREDCSHVGEFDYVIINDDFATAEQDLLAVVRAQRLRINAQLDRHSDLIASLT